MSELQQQYHQGNTEQVPFGVVQHNLSNIMPSASEIGNLWSSYQAETMSVCFLKYYVAKSKDPDIHAVLQRALDISSQRVITMENIYNSFNHPIPVAYGQRDVDINAKQLFNETFELQYTRLMHKFVLINYCSALTVSSRSDIRAYFLECITTSCEIHQKATEVLLAKGLLSKSPSIAIPDRVDFIHDKDYFGSYLNLGNKRPLNSLEISHLVSLIEAKELLKTLNLGYGQVVKSEVVKKYISQAKQIADKQLSRLASFLDDEDLPLTIAFGNAVSNSTESPQSDKMIMSHVAVAISFIIAQYGLALSSTSRKDLVAVFTKYAIELQSFAKDGAVLMIECGWLERIPETPDRKKLLS